MQLDLSRSADCRRKAAPAWLGSIALAMAMGVTYFLAARLSLELLSMPDGVAVFWPAAGIAAGTLIALGPIARWPVVAGVMGATMAANLTGDRNIASAVVFSLCNAGEAALIAWLIEHHFGADFSLDALRRALGFFVATAVATTVSGIAATAGFALFHPSEASLLTVWMNWLASDAIGVVTVAPLMIGLIRILPAPPSGPKMLEGVVSLAVLATVSTVSFGSDYMFTVLPLGLLLPLLIWPAARCPPVFAAAAACIVSLVIVVTMTLGIGRLGDPSIALVHRVHAAQIALLGMSTCALVLAALCADMRSHQRVLKESADRLQLALDSAELGVWSLDIKTGRFQSDARDREIHDYRPDQPPETVAAARPFIHPSDLPVLDAAFAASKRTGARCKVEYRVAPASNGILLPQERWAALEGTVVRDAHGRAVQFLGITRNISDSKQAERALAERDLQLALAGKFALVGNFAFDVDSGRMQVSAGYSAIHGLAEGTAESSRADWRARVHPDDLSDVEAGFAQAVADKRREHYCEYRIVGSSGEIRWIDSRSFITYRDGAAPRLVGANIDVTQRKQTEAALKEREASLADALDAGQVMAFEWNAITGQSRRSLNAARIIGDDQSGVDSRQSNQFLKRVHPEDRPSFKAHIKQLSRDNSSYAVNFRFCCRDDRQVWLEETARGEFDATGKLLHIKGLTRDITERKHAELALEERNIQVALAEKATLVGSFAYDVDTEIMQISEGYAVIHGFPEGTTEIARSQCLAGVHSDDIEWVEQARSQSFRARRREYNVEYRITRADGEVRWVETRCFIAYASDGHPQRVLGVSIDITERKHMEQQQHLLVAELDHRVKNTLATVAAIIAQTQEGRGSLPDFVAALDGRIQALAKTHELLSRSHWAGVSLHDIVQRELAPYETGNVEIDGPQVELKPEAAQAMAMVVHELATNAAKYGALSTRSGRVRLCWWWLRNGSSGWLAVEWREIDGPPVQPPSQTGYGMSIIRELVPFELSGKVDLALEPAGVTCRMEIPPQGISEGRPPAPSPLPSLQPIT